MGDNIYSVYQYLSNINPNTTVINNLKKRDVAPAITFSVFDKSGKSDSDGNQTADGLITKDEFNAVSKEDYEKYCQQVKQEINKNPKDPLGLTGNSIKQFIAEEGITDVEYIASLESKYKDVGSQKDDLTSVSPVGYNVLKKYIEKHGSIDFETLKSCELSAEETIQENDKDKDGFISKKENIELYKQNNKKDLNFNDVINYCLNNQ